MKKPRSPGLAARIGVASWRDLDPRQAHSQRGVAHNGSVPRPPLHQLSSGVESDGMEPVAGQSGSVGTVVKRWMPIA